MKKFWHIAEVILDKMKMVGAFCLGGMTLLTCADVVGRKLGHPIFGSVEIVGYLSILTIAMALPYTHQVGAHIGVELVVRRFSDKVQIIIDIVTGTLSLTLFAIVTWRMLIYARTMQKSGEVSMNLQFPEHVIIYLVALCFLMFVISIARQISLGIAKLREKT